jgi:hypothetical protein
VGHGHRQVLLADAGVALLEDLRRPPPQQVLGDVQVLLDDRDAPAVGTLDDDRARRQPRLGAVRRRAARRVRSGIDAVLPDGRPVGGVLPR